MFDLKDCLVSFRTAQSVKLRILFESLHAILGDAIVDFTPEGVFLTATTSNGLVVLNLFKANIDEYVCTENVECGIKFSNLYAYLKNVTDSDVVAIQVTREGYTGQGGRGAKAYLFICNDGEAGKCDAYRAAYEIRLFLMQRITLKVPDALYMDTCVTLPASTFQRFLRSHEKVDPSPEVNIQILAHISDVAQTGVLPQQGDVYFVSESVEAKLTTSSAFPLFRSTDDTSNVFAMQLDDAMADEENEATGSATVTATTETPPPAEDSIKFVVDARFIQQETSIFYSHRSSDKNEQYSLKVLLEIAKMTNMSHSVRLFLAPNSPLAIVYDVGTLGMVLLFVSPREDEVVNCSLRDVVPQNQSSLPTPRVGAQMNIVSKAEFERATASSQTAGASKVQKRSKKAGGALKVPRAAKKRKVAAHTDDDDKGDDDAEEDEEQEDADTYMARAAGL